MPWSKLIALYFFSVIFVSHSFASEGNLMTSEVVIKGIGHERGGDLVFMVFEKDGIPKDHSKAIYKKSISPNSTEFKLNIDLPNGEFALKVHHDENADGKVSKNWTKILPGEGLAFSNGARVRFGPPSFKSARLLGEESQEVELKMIYPRRKKK